MKRYSKEEKEMWLEDWEASGQSAWSYAKANGLSGQTFANWAKKRKRAFVEVTEKARECPRALGMAATGDQNLEILIEKEDIKVHIPLKAAAFNFAAFMRLLGVAS